METFCCRRMQDAVTHGYTLGSHYHCARCNKETGMMGHYCRHMEIKKGKVTFTGEHHFCCPGDCELENV